MNFPHRLASPVYSRLVFRRVLALASFVTLSLALLAGTRDGLRADTGPVADAGGPYMVLEGGSVTLDANDTLAAEKLEQIGLALHNYLDVNGRFPPAWFAEVSGPPLYSWRVLLLPYLDQAPHFNMISAGSGPGVPTVVAGGDAPWNGWAGWATRLSRRSDPWVTIGKSVSA